MLKAILQFVIIALIIVFLIYGVFKNPQQASKVLKTFIDFVKELFKFVYETFKEVKENAKEKDTNRGNNT